MKDYNEKKKRKADRKLKKRHGRAFDLRGFLRTCIRSTLLALLITGISGAIYGGWTYLTTSKGFIISNVEVEGNRKIPRSEILRIADTDGEKNIFTFDVKKAGRDIEEIPWIKEVAIERHYPDTLLIKVTERQPEGLINLGQLFYFDMEGNIFAAADSDTGLDFPVIGGINKEKLLEGDQDAFRLMTEGIALLQTIKNEGIKLPISSISELVFAKSGDVTLYPSGTGVPVCLGNSNLGKRFRQAERVMADLDEKGIKAARINAGYDNRVFVKRLI